MRIILLVLLFLIWEESATPGAVHWHLVDPVLGVALFFIGYLLLILVMRFFANRIASGLIRGDPGRAVEGFNWGMAIARAAVPTWFAIGVFALGWKPVVDRILEPIAGWPIIAPGTILGLLPGFLAWTGLWWSQFPVDRALREQNVLYQLESDLPVFSNSGFQGYFLNKLRAQLLFTVVPVLAILLLRDVAALVVTAVSHTATGRRWGLTLPISDSLESIISFAAAVVVLLFSPELLRRVLSTQPLPDSYLRQSLSHLCDRAGVRCRGILLWRTQNNMGNAAVMGLLPRVRYVMLSDLLLESMTDLQIQAVFAHELGHVKHRHLVWFVLYFVAAGSCLFGVAGALESNLHLAGDWQQAFDIGSLVLEVLLLLVGYGFLSRWFERQADVYAARTLESGQVGPQGFGAEVFASALERVAVVNNIPVNARNWTHGSIQTRVRYINRLGRDPAVAARFDRIHRRVFVTLICLMVVCGALSVYLLR